MKKITDFIRRLGIDYIVEQGTDGDWEYRKWKSGKFEAWYAGSITISCTTPSTAYGGYRSTNQIPVAIPSAMQSWTFRNINITKMNSGAPWTNDYYRDGNTILGYWHAGSSESATARKISIYCYGTWR
ncbi:MAG: hypothetical protein K6B42_07580 [Clostridia bacterium]|nr:hypothetical protein [Clostridia bacterium]